ncbi:MAG: hypothetical protein ACRD6I_09935, partial [Candidatus Acidiferrales bacterium]
MGGPRASGHGRQVSAAWKIATWSPLHHACQIVRTLSAIISAGRVRVLHSAGMHSDAMPGIVQVALKFQSGMP